MTKKCASCSTIKNVSEFGKNGLKKDGLQTYCKPCMKKANNTHYQKSKKKYKDNARNFKLKIRKFLAEFKTGKPCKDCNQIYPHYVMDFDHLSDKKYGIAKTIGSKSIETLMLEIAKCELVCSNCHRIRTWDRKEQTKLGR